MKLIIMVNNMERLLVISAVCILLSITGKAQDLYLKNENSKYSFKKKDSVGSMYLNNGAESIVRIDLYDDSLYGYHVFIAIPMKVKFSAGTWKIKNDSLLVLQSDKRLFEKVFNRTERQKPIKKYTFLDFDPLIMVIYPEKCIYPIRKIIKQ
jgi:hypothetical protein